MPQYPPEVIDTLSTINASPRDPFILFDPEPHTYTVTTDPDSQYMSVTTWIHTLFEEFDADAIITKMFKSRNWGPKHKYWGQTREQIKEGWDKNGKEASEAGTEMHYRIETFNNMVVPDNPLPTYQTLLNYYDATYDPLDPQNTMSTEWQYFKNYVKAHPHFKPYRTEWMVYYEELQISGSIDMIYENPDGTLMIYDWKRAKNIVETDTFNKRGIPECISNLPDTNYWHYTLQLNIYKMILEEKYGKHVTALCLVVLHPNNFNGDYLLYPVPFLPLEIHKLKQHRLTQLGKSIELAGPAPALLADTSNAATQQQPDQEEDNTNTKFDYNICLF